MQVATLLPVFTVVEHPVTIYNNEKCLALESTIKSGKILEVSANAIPPPDSTWKSAISTAAPSMNAPEPFGFAHRLILAVVIEGILIVVQLVGVGLLFR